MQYGKKQQAVTISFSRKNKDIFDFLQEKKNSTEFNQNEFICNAIRFYEKYKDRNLDSTFDSNYINELIDKKLSEFKNSLKNGMVEISLDEDEEISPDALESDFTLGNLDDD